MSIVLWLSREFYCWQTDLRSKRMKGKETRGYPAKKFMDLKMEILLKLKFDIKNTSLRFYYNEKDLGISHDNIKINHKYCLGISFAAKTQRFQLLDFSAE